MKKLAKLQALGHVQVKLQKPDHRLAERKTEESGCHLDDNKSSGSHDLLVASVPAKTKSLQPHY